jgi:hypothetical protein
MHITRGGLLFAASERGLDESSEMWRATNAHGGSGADACSFEYRGRPNAIVSVGPAAVGFSGGDVDTAVAPVPDGGHYRLYVVSLGGQTLSVSHSDDDGITWSTVRVDEGAGVLLDRPWIAAYGPATVIVTYSGGNVVRSDDGGNTFVTGYPSWGAGNLAVDHRTTDGIIVNSFGRPGFWAYQAGYGVLRMSNDGGIRWWGRGIPCPAGQGFQFPSVAVDPQGRVWVAGSDNTDVWVAVTSDHGATWDCDKVTASLERSLLPWIVATGNGVDLAFYATSSADDATADWDLYLAQNLTNQPGGWTAPQSVVYVHHGPVCLGGFGCTANRQLYDDFALDVDPQGWAHIVYSHDVDDPRSAVGKQPSATGYAVQTSGARVGQVN